MTTYAPVKFAPVIAGRTAIVIPLDGNVREVRTNGLKVRTLDREGEKGLSNPSLAIEQRWSAYVSRPGAKVHTCSQELNDKTIALVSTCYLPDGTEVRKVHDLEYQTMKLYVLRKSGASITFTMDLKNPSQVTASAYTGSNIGVPYIVTSQDPVYEPS